MNTMGLQFEKFTWGDPLLAQIGNSDAQAYMDYPSTDALTTMTSGLEQAPQELVDALSGSGVGNAPTTQLVANTETCHCNTYNPADWFRACCWSYLNPLNGDNWNGKNQTAGKGGGGINVAGVTDWKGLAVVTVLGLLAVGIILIGVKGMLEA